MTSLRPGIYKLGTVRDDGTTVVISGWGISYCAAHCDCHNHPTVGFLAIAVTDDGTLGLVSYRECDCCSPWTVTELQAVLRDVGDVATMEVTG